MNKNESCRCNMDCTVPSSSSSECDVHVAEGVLYSLLFILGLVLNVSALWVFMVRRSSWTDTHIYLINLTIADLALILYLPFRIYDAFYCLDPHEPGTQPTWLCTWLMGMHYVNMYVSILTSTAISVHRFLVVRFPFHARSWRRKKQAAFAVCLAIWTVVLTLWFCVFIHSNHPSKLWTCFERCENDPLPLEKMVSLLTLGFLAPLLIIVFCSGQFIWILRKGERDSAEKKNIVGIVTANMVVFIVCYTPIHVAMLLDRLIETPEDWSTLSRPAKHRFFIAAEWITTFNCCLDSICFYILLKGIGPWRTRVPTQDAGTTLTACHRNQSNCG